MLFRPEIQGLRSVAVASVLVFHIWPGLLPGGFVGVDVFFVISGYLITTLLFGAVEESGRISLIGFYDRRIRRILPAASLVLLVVTAALPLLPKVRWEDTATGIVAAALYAENWLLAHQAVDYLALDNLPSPVQHYWSLSIEEQFYVVWPLVMIGVSVVAARRGGNRRRTFLWPLSIIVAASFVASVIVTPADPAAAYFVTYTRVWELGIGALLALAVVPRLPPPLSELTRTAGLALIVLACFVITPDTAFPGYAALLPTIGSGLIIAAGPEPSRWGSYRLLANPILVYVGGISYSLYLWHWPLIIFFTVYFPGPPSILAGIGLIAATTVLADLTKRLVEDPFRRMRLASLKVIAAGFAVIAACTLLPAATFLFTGSGPLSLASGDSAYPGAAALFGATVPAVDAPLPPLARLKRDRPAGYRAKCHLSIDQTEPHPCEYGRKKAGFQVVVVGDSHAAMWTTAFDDFARTYGWHVLSHTKSGCAFVETLTTRKERPRYETCLAWVRQVLETLRKNPPDVVIFAQANGERLYSPEDDATPQEMAAAIAAVWSEIRAMGSSVIAIRDVPWLPFDPGECLSGGRPCIAPRDAAARKPEDDVMEMAARITSDTPVVDMTDTICTATECPTVIGNVIVWRDTNHLTTTYVKTLTPYLLDRLVKASPLFAAATGRPPPRIDGPGRARKPSPAT